MLKRIQKIFHREPKEESQSVFEEIDSMFDSLNDDVLLITIGTDLIKYSELVSKKISEVRQEIKSECGFILPPVRICDNTYLQENEFNISIYGNILKSAYIIPNEKGINEELYETLKSTVYEYMDILFTNEITEKYVEKVQKNNGWLIWNITCKVSMTDIKTIMLDIIKKGKSINNINYIFEQIGEMVLANGKFGECGAKHNPHLIAKQIVKQL